jgi:hypothetical protein
MISNRDPRPEVLRLEELALLVKSGDIKLPKFQRPFVWKRSEMLLLLDSIYKGYPIGSLLLWNSSQPLKSVRAIADLVVDGKNESYPTSYLLDGQQRLTTLCGALFWQGGASDSLWNIWFDLGSETFFHAKGVNTELAFPLNKIIDTGEFIAQCMRFQHLDDRQVYVDRAQKLLRAVKDYKIAVVKIGDMSIEEVAPIFERINSTGRKLTMVDLMMAATWSNGFDLSGYLKKIVDSSDEAGLSGVPEPFVLRSIAAAAGLGINKDDIQKLRGLEPAELKESADACGEAFVKAAGWIYAGLGIQDVSYLPYGMFLTHVVEFFRVVKNPDEAQLAELKAWFWFTAITSYFSGANTGQNSRDISLVRDFAKGEVGELFERRQIDITRFLFDRFNLRNASSTTFALMLLSLKPMASISGRAISIESAIEKSGRLFHAVHGGKLPDKNVCMIINPYREAASSASSDDGLLRSHLINQAVIDASVRGNYYDFFEFRASLITDFIRRVTGCGTTFVGVVDDSDDLFGFNDLFDENE